MVVAQFYKPVVGFPASVYERFAEIDSLAAGVVSTKNAQQPFIRAANLGELLLAVLTLIVIRNTSSRSNTPPPAPRRVVVQLDDEDDSPNELDTSARTPARRPEFVNAAKCKTHVSSEQKKTTKTHVSFNSSVFRPVLARLRCG